MKRVWEEKKWGLEQKMVTRLFLQTNLSLLDNSLLFHRYKDDLMHGSNTEVALVLLTQLPWIRLL